MFVRIFTGIVLAVLVLIGILFFPAYILKGVITAFTAIAAYECGRMILPKDSTTSLSFVIVLTVLFSALMMFGPKDYATLLGGVPAVIIITFSFYLFKTHSLDLVLKQVSRTVLIVLYCGLLFSFLGLLRDLPDGRAWLILVLAATFCADTGAYFTGKILGRHKLAPRVSPGKTLEGFFGGVVASVGAAFVVKFLLFKGFTVSQCLWVGGISGLVGPLGDLSESLMKRSVGVKDSGNLIPGHGGILDRVDALLFTAPMVYWYAEVFANR